MTDHQSSDSLTLQEVQAWHKQEIEDSNKAHELRLKQANQLLRDYEKGMLSPQEATTKLYEYDMRWGDALFGVNAVSSIPDDQLLQAIDAARNKQENTHARRARRGRSSADTKPFL